MGSRVRVTPPWRARREAAPRSSRLGARPGLRPDGPYGPGPVYVRPLARSSRGYASLVAFERLGNLFYIQTLGPVKEEVPVRATEFYNRDP